MAILYRSEKKKILVSHMDLLRHVISILERVEQIFVNDENEVSNQAYKELLLEENQIES